LFSGVCYANQAQQYTALSQPVQLNLGNGLQQRYTYSGNLARLSQFQVGTSSTPGSVFNRSYSYDNGGNVKTITNNQTSQTQSFGYNELDRLISASLSSILN
jgi:YD repeat-containing protein